jgi:hypothetical protein
MRAIGRRHQIPIVELAERLEPEHLSVAYRDERVAAARRDRRNPDDCRGVVVVLPPLADTSRSQPHVPLSVKDSGNAAASPPACDLLPDRGDTVETGLGTRFATEKRS